MEACFQGAIVNRQIGIAEEQQEFLVEHAQSVSQCSPCPQRPRFSRVSHRHTAARAVAEIALDLLSQVADRHENPTKTLVGEVVDDVLHERPTANLDHGLRYLMRQRPKTSTEPTG